VRGRKNRGLVWLGVSALVILLVAAAACELLLSSAEPVLQARLVQSLAARYRSGRELEDAPSGHKLRITRMPLRTLPHFEAWVRFQPRRHEKRSRSRQVAVVRLQGCIFVHVLDTSLSTTE
jgi:hypothetical protein